MRETRPLRMTVVAGIAALLAAAAVSLAGCGGNGGATAPPGPPESTVKETPAATASAGATQTSSVHAGNVSADTYNAVIAAIRKNGMTVQNPSSVRVTYGADKEHATANGSFVLPASQGGKSVGTVSLQLEPQSGDWKVVNVQ